MTESEWKRELAAHHPDRGGDHATFVALVTARDAWRKANGVCAWEPCGKVFPKRKGQPQTYCSRHCANLGKSDRRGRTLAEWAV